jgi:hypothetical protein
MMTRGQAGEHSHSNPLKACVWEGWCAVPKPSSAKKIPTFTYTCLDGLHRYDFPDAPIADVFITIETPGRNHLGQLWSTVKACFGSTTAAVSQFNLLDMQKRVDFERVAAVFDGQVPWHDFLLSLLPDLLDKELVASFANGPNLL